MYHVLFIQSSVDDPFICYFLLLAIVNVLLQTWMYKYLFTSPCSVLLGMYPEVELLGYMINLFLIFEGITMLFTVVAAPSYIPSSTVQSYPRPPS